MSVYATSPGSAVIISHDRWFLDRVSSHMIAYEGGSNVMFFEGNYTEYAEDYKQRFSKNYRPERIKYRKMS